MPLKLSGPFAEPDARWQLTCGEPGRFASFAHAVLLRTALSDLQGAERRQERGSIAQYLLRPPPTHRFHLERIVGNSRVTIVLINCKLQGDTPHEKSPAQQAEAICKFFEFLLYQDDAGQMPWPKCWEYAQPGGLAYLFWLSALVSRYCDLWGVG